MKYLVTGAAGFIGSYVSKRLLDAGHEVVGLDNLNDYYSVQLKKDRLARLTPISGFMFHEMDLANRDAVASLFAQEKFDRVIHLGAQAGVRYSLEAPFSYVDSNITGTLTILEGCRDHGVGHLVYASSSSVYGLNTKMPYSTTDRVDHPLSLYAATKKSNELMAHTYSHLYGIPTTGLRFFTVYGPWGRPDMALYLFTKAIKENRAIKVFNNGKLKRDFTYIDDIVEGVVRVADQVPEANADWAGTADVSNTSRAPYRIFNIGNNQPVELETFISAIESAMGKEAIRDYQPMQPGDVMATYADVADLSELTGFSPATPIEDGVKHFVDWFNDYHYPS